MFFLHAGRNDFHAADHCDLGSIHEELFEDVSGDAGAVAASVELLVSVFLEPLADGEADLQCLR